jgi:hypothetical protein
MRIRQLIAVFLLSAAYANAQFDLPTHRIVPTDPSTVGELRFLELTGYWAGATGEYVALKGPSDVAATFSIELPAALAGDTRCLEITSAGVIQLAAASCGGSGSLLTVQESDTSPSVASVTTLNFNQADGFTVTSGGAGIATVGFSGGVAPFVDTTSIVKGSGDATKLLRFEVDGFTTATTRVATPPNQDFTMAGLNVVETFTSQQTFSGSLHMASDVHFDSDSTYDIATISVRPNSIFTDNMNADALALSNDAHSTHWTIERRSANESYLDFKNPASTVLFSVLDSSGIVLPEGSQIIWMDSGAVIPLMESSNGDLIVGPQAAPAASNVAFFNQLNASAKSSVGDSYVSSIRFDQFTDGTSEFGPNQASTDLGDAGTPWGSTYTDELVVNIGATIDFGTGEADMSSANVYMRNIAASSGLSCTGVADGFFVTTDDLYIAMCIGGARYRAILATY